MLRNLAVFVVNALARLADKAVCSWPNTTDTPICRVCRRADCDKDVI